MKRKYIPIAALASSALGTGIPAEARTPEKPTNFIVILMDDMGYGDIRANGSIGYATPNFERMAAAGMLFTHYYAPQAVSGASRAGLLTGCYPNRIGLTGAPFPNAQTGISAEETTVAELLKQKGYACAAYGKWHLGDAEEFLPLRHGFDEYYGIPYSNDMWPNHPSYPFPDLPLIEGEEVVAYNPDQTRFTTDFTDRAIAFIDRHKDAPFFIYLAHPMPHVPLFVSDKFRGKSGQGLYGDVIMELDWSIGQVLDKLEKEKLDRNTLVVVLSDNGPWLNYGNHAGSTGGLRGGKGNTFEGGQRVPCLMQWKGTIPEGSVCEKMLCGIDLLPTFAAVAGTGLPERTIDGVDVSPLLRGVPGAEPRNSLWYYYNANDLEAVSDGVFKLIFPHLYRRYEGYLPGSNGRPGPVYEGYALEEKLLIDMRRDPGERFNVLGLYPEVLEKLKRMADEARAELGDDLTGVSGRGRRSPGRLVQSH